MSNSITPTEKAQTMNLGGTMAFVQATLQRFNSEVIAPLIPAQASGSNQLADKAFVNSSIATATATYRGNFNLVSDLELTVSATEQQIVAALATAISTADNNDYCYVAVPTADDKPTEIARIDRYKHNGTAWALEYTLNNSGFTAAEWAAIQSGITSGLVAKLNGIEAGAQAHIAPTTAEVKAALGTGSGTTKFYREDGTWQEVDAAPEKNGFGIGTCSTSSGTALTVSLTDYELVTNGFVAVTFENDVPANATLNINGKGPKPIIYKGSAIEADTIKADDTVMFCYNGSQYVVTSLGGGSGGTIVWPEFVNISLTSDEGDDDQNLIGATVVITDDNTSETILSTTWQGTNISLRIDEGTDYTVTVGAVQFYFIEDNTKSYTAVGGNLRIIEFKYYGGSVDLGLPSGLLWSSKNIGAETPIDPGLYFSGGNIEGHAKGSGYNFSYANYASTPGASITGAVPLSQDPAYQNSGRLWRLPTDAEVTELLNNTDKTWTSISGRYGWKFAKKTDNSIYIFIPAHGFYDNSATLNGDNTNMVVSVANATNRVITANSSEVQLYSHNSYCGYTVRGVR